MTGELAEARMIGDSERLPKVIFQLFGCTSKSRVFDSEKAMSNVASFSDAGLNRFLDQFDRAELKAQPEIRYAVELAVAEISKRGK